MSSKLIRLFASALAVATLLVALNASSAEYENHHSGINWNYTKPAPVIFQNHYYQVIRKKGISWEYANYAAMNSTFMGVTGHLATISSAAEDSFIESLRADTLYHKEAWIGGLQTPSTCTPQPGCGWMWVNDEGPIATTQFPGPSYSNWLPGEPDNMGNAHHLAIGRYGEFGWNDEHKKKHIGGYVIEYDTQVPITDCIAAGGCTTNAGQTQTYPSSSVFPTGATLGVNSFEFTDDPSRCGLSDLVLFDGDGIPDNELIIPPYLCGSPKFIVVATDSSSVEVLQDTIDVENDVTIALPANLYECTGPINPVPDPDLDPQHRDVVAWQSTNPAAMLENSLGGSFGFPGALTEVTYECGTSRGRVRRGSYYIIGMHIDFGAGFEFATNPTGNHDRFVALTRYKLEVLKASVLESYVALDPHDFKVLKKLIVKAIHLHDHGRFRDALKKMELFEYIVNSITYATIPGENFNGDHLMRSDNIQFMYTDKVIPYQPHHSYPPHY